jgi:hypothetical protein
MEFLSFSPTTEAVLTLAVVAAMFALFVRESYPAEVVALPARDHAGRGRPAL